MGPADHITLESLRQFPAHLEAHFSAVPVSHRGWNPDSWEGIPSERLNAIGQICHVRDVEIDGYQLRIARMLAEHNPHLGSLDSDALVVQRNYAAADFEKILAEFKRARAHTLDLISHLSAAQWQRIGEFEGYGALTLRGLIHYLSSHDQQHLAGMQWLLGKIDASASAT